MSEIPEASSDDGATAEVAPPTRRLSTTTLAASIAGGVAFVCAFLPWARVFLFTLNGTDGDGMIVAVGSGASLLLLLALYRASSRHFAIAAAAVVGAAVSALTYGFDLARISRLMNGTSAAEAMFGDAISVGFGLVIGALASGAALVAMVVLAVHVRKSGDLRAEPENWDVRRLSVVMLAGATLAVCAAEKVWALSIIFGTATAVGWYLTSKPSRLNGAVGAFVIVAVVAGVGGGAFGATRSSGSGLALCDQLFAQGADVNAIVGTDVCKSGTGTTFVFTMDYECYDGSTLYVSDDGWGYSDQKWVTSGDAPVDVCTSDAEEDCTALFADGVTTESSWEFFGPDCFGEDGKPVTVESGIEFCDDFATLVYNDYGWGKEGEPWHAGEPKPATC